MSTSYGSGTGDGRNADPRADDTGLERGDPRTGDAGASREGDHGSHARDTGAVEPVDRRDAITRQKDAFGGMKIGAAFFGWLTATGLAVLLTAIVAAAGTAISVSSFNGVDQLRDKATQNATTVGIGGAIVLLVIMVVSYYCGGYVAGRMARFNGLRQGLAVWVWGIVIAIIIAIISAIAGSKYDILSKLNSFPRIPVKQGDLTTGGVIALIIVAVASLIGALLGGLAGMHFHRKIDKVGLAD